MLTPQKLAASLALLFPFASALADPVAYVVNGPLTGAAQFGTVDLSTGAFTQIGPKTPLGSQGLAAGPNGSLFTLDFSGNLVSINQATGVSTVIGPTGLADCSVPGVSPCGSHSANAPASLNGKIYVTDFANNLYSVNTQTGAATLVGARGIPGLPFTPGLSNPDGSFNFYDEGLFGANGSLYATFDAGTFDPATFAATAVIAPDLYRIAPLTGVATLVGPTHFNLDAVAGIGGAYYGFDAGRSEIVTLDLATGNTTDFGGFDPNLGIVTGAAATPEPASMALAAIGLVGVAVGLRRRRRLL